MIASSSLSFVFCLNILVFAVNCGQSANLPQSSQWWHLKLQKIWIIPFCPSVEYKRNEKFLKQLSGPCSYYKPLDRYFTHTILFFATGKEWHGVSKSVSPLIALTTWSMKSWGLNILWTRIEIYFNALLWTCTWLAFARYSKFIHGLWRIASLTTS